MMTLTNNGVSSTRLTIARRLTIISKMLREAEETYAVLVGEEREVHAGVWENVIGQGGSQWIAEKSATISDLPRSVRIINLTGKIKALVEERDHLRFCIKYNLDNEAL